MSKSILYKAAAYVRLSKEDANIGSNDKIGSNSINNQKALIMKEIESMSNVLLYDVYIDDGYTGLNFNRPSFKSLMKDIQDNKVNMIVVKDLSRLGRDYIEVGEYIKKIFPTLGIRFVSILDHFDSLIAPSSEINLLVPVKNFVNDSYSRDISIKIRSHQEIMRNSGLYVGAYVTYGYKKSDHNKNLIVIDDYAADIVRKIFSWKLDGFSCEFIANKLNKLDILAPSEYKRRRGINYKSGFENSLNAKWSAITIKRLLSNKIYIGTLEQGKKEKISYKLEKVIEKPQENWSVVQNSHEKIISQNDFYTVQRLLKIDTRISPQEDATFLFSGLIFCGECCANMVHRIIKYKDKKRVYYICSSYNKGKNCSRHSILEENLKEIVLKSINKHIDNLVEFENILKSIDNLQIDCNDVIVNNKELKNKKEELIKYKQKEIILNNDYKDGLVSKEEYKDFLAVYKDKCDRLEKSIKNIEVEISKVFENNLLSFEWIDNFKKYRNIKKINRLILITLIQKIVIHEDKRIEIVFNYKDEYDSIYKVVNCIKNTIPINKGGCI